MVEKFKLNDKEYEVKNLSDKAKILLKNMQFTSKRIQELNNMQKLLNQARNGYIENLKKEMLSKKAGLLLGDE